MPDVLGGRPVVPLGEAAPAPIIRFGDLDPRAGDPTKLCFFYSGVEDESTGRDSVIASIGVGF